MALLATLLVAGWHTQLPWWASGEDIEEMRQSVADGTGNEGVDEYVPIAADPTLVNKDLPRLTDATAEAINGADSSEAASSEARDNKTANTNIVNATIQQWSATEKRFQWWHGRRGT